MNATIRPLLIAALLVQSLFASAQVPASSNSAWQRVQTLPAGTTIRINAPNRNTTCMVKMVDADALTCIRGHLEEAVFQRAEIKRISFPHHVRSTLIGAGIGASFGIGIGAAMDRCDSYGYDCNSRAALMAAGGLVYGAIGALTGWATSFVVRSTVYKAS